MDTSHIRHPLCQDGLIGDAWTHGFSAAGRKIANGQNYNIGTAEVGSKVVAEPRSTRAELSRRAGGPKLLNEEMLIAYGE